MADNSWLNGFANIVRAKVSADKKRFQENGFDLDLTYITDRVIGSFFRDTFTFSNDHRLSSSSAMSFPANGMEIAFRNNSDDVAAMLRKYHPVRIFIVPFFKFVLLSIH
jgi:hypothetical protein